MVSATSPLGLRLSQSGSCAPRKAAGGQRLRSVGAQKCNTMTGEGSPVTITTPLLPGGDACASTNTAALRRVLSVAGLYVVAVGLTIPSRPAIMLAASGGDSGRAALFAGVVDAVQAVVSAMTGPVLGSLTDAVGRVPILHFSAASECFALLLVATFSASLVGQFVAYMFIAATGVFVTVISTAIADLCPRPAAATRAYGHLGAVVGAGFMVGPVLGGAISKHAGDIAPLLAGSAFLALLVPFITHVVPETRVQEADEHGDINSVWWQRANDAARSVTWENPVPQIRRVLFECPALGWLVLSGTVSSLAQSGLISVMFLYVNARLGWGAPQLGAFVSATGLAVLVGQGVLAPVLVQFFGEKVVIVAGYIFASVHFVVYGLARHGWMLFAGLVVAIPAFAAEPATKAVLARQVPSEKQGELQGSLGALKSILRPFSTLGCAAIFAVGNHLGMPGAVFYVIAALSLVAAVMANAALTHPALK